MVKRDYYEILGLSKKASCEEIKKSYRKLAMQYHPDRNNSPDSEEKFKEISEAYAILSNYDRRQQYDLFGHPGIDTRYSREDIFRGVNFEDILRDLGIFGFGRGGGIFDIIFRNERNKGPRRGSDILYKLHLDLEDTVSGKKSEIEVPKIEICNLCNGNGAKAGTYPRQCSSCLGKGQINITQNTPFGRFVNFTTCGICKGIGTIIDTPCTSCNGSGKIQINRKIEIKIPPGIDTGTRIRLAGEGGLGENGGPTGDLYVEIGIRPHNKFIRQGNDIITEETISFVQAALGVEITVSTLNGNTKMKVPAGTQNSQTIRLKGKGIPSLYNSGKGDLLVNIKVKVPTNLSERQIQILKEFDDINEKIKS